RRRHTRFSRDWSSDVCSSDLGRKWQGSASAGIPLSDAGWIRFTAQAGHQDYTNRAGPNRTRPQEGVTQRYGDPEVTDRNLMLNEIGRASCRERGRRTDGATRP